MSNKTEELKLSSASKSKGGNKSINLHKLANVRIIQKHLVYVIGLSENLALKEVSKQHKINLRH